MNRDVNPERSGTIPPSRVPGLERKGKEGKGEVNSPSTPPSPELTREAAEHEPPAASTAGQGDAWMEELLDDLAGVIYRVECNWDREGSGPGSRFKDEPRAHAQARGVIGTLEARGLLRPVVAAAARVAPVDVSGGSEPVEAVAELVESLERVTAERDEARRGLEMCDAEISGLRVRAERAEAERDEAQAVIAAVRDATSVAFKGSDETDADRMLAAAHRLDCGYPLGGQHTRAMVASLLRTVAALGAVPAHAAPLPDGERITDDNGDEAEHGEDDDPTDQEREL